MYIDVQCTCTYVYIPIPDLVQVVWELHPGWVLEGTYMYLYMYMYT